MRTDQFFAHHGITTNPFSEEDALTDQVFKSRCVDIRHPAWDKVYGDPANPATSLVFGEKGSGKTAMRLQIAESLEKHNEAAEKGDRIWVVNYDDFNPFLDHFADRLSARKQRDPSRVLAEWKLWDHMDGILSIAVTDLVDRLLGVEAPRGPEANRVDSVDARKRLDTAQKRDLLVLAACYDNSTAQPLNDRWRRLRRVLRFSRLSSKKWFMLGLLVTLAVAGAIGYFKAWDWVNTAWPYLAVSLGWLPWFYKWCDRKFMAFGIRRHLRVLRRDSGVLSRLLMRFRDRDLDNQPLPNHDRTDDRYEMLAKLQGVLRSLGSKGIVVLVDRVDEPHLTGGQVEHMRDFIWPLLDNKFLKQPGIGIKLLLPSELHDHINREDRDFHQRARLDKQNVVPSLDWTGEALGDLANARLTACAAERMTPTLRSLVDLAISDARLTETLRMLRTPRHMFKFLFRLVSTHCNSHVESDPVWEISPETFEAVLAVYSHEQATVDRGLSA